MTSLSERRRDERLAEGPREYPPDEYLRMKNRAIRILGEMFDKHKARENGGEPQEGPSRD